MRTPIEHDDFISELMNHEGTNIRCPFCEPETEMIEPMPRMRFLTVRPLMGIICPKCSYRTKVYVLRF